MCPLRGAVQQAAQITAGTRGRVVFQRLAAGEHERNNRRRQILPNRQRRRHRHDGQNVEPELPPHQLFDHVDDGQQDDEPDEHRRHQLRSGGQAGKVQRENNDELHQHRGQQLVLTENAHHGSHTPILPNPRISASKLCLA